MPWEDYLIHSKAKWPRPKRDLQFWYKVQLADSQMYLELWNVLPPPKAQSLPFQMLQQHHLQHTPILQRLTSRLLHPKLKICLNFLFLSFLFFFFSSFLFIYFLDAMFHFFYLTYKQRKKKKKKWKNERIRISRIRKRIRKEERKKERKKKEKK